MDSYSQGRHFAAGAVMLLVVAIGQVQATNRHVTNNTSVVLLGSTALGATATANGSQDDADKSKNSPSRPAISTHGMISSAHPLATQAGLDILAAGGNAFDAAVAVAATLNVVEPMMSGLGGYGVMLIYDASKREVRFLDGSGRMPEALNSDVFRPPTPNYLQNRRGAKVVSTPGNANTWEMLSKSYGKLKWQQLFRAAIKLADEGFIVTENTAGFIQFGFPDFPEYAKSIYGYKGEPLKAGQRLVQKDLAKSLNMIAEQGASAIYGGELGKAIDASMRETGGFLTMEDLRKNRAEWWRPISIDYRGYRVVAPSAPTNAWNGLLRLGIMSRFNVSSLGHNSPAYLHRYAEVTKLAYRDRLEFAGDPDVKPPPLDKLLSESYWSEMAGRINLQRATPFEALNEPVTAGQHTTHFVVADRWGNVVCATQTIGNLFGSKIMVKGTGIWLNDSLSYSTFEPKGNPMDAFPGRWKLSGFCPVIIIRDGKPWVAIGTPGGHTILQTVPQMVINIVDFDMDIQQAIAAPRISFVELPPPAVLLLPASRALSVPGAQSEPNVLLIEEGVPELIRKQLSAMGHNIRVVPRTSLLKGIGNAHGLTIEYDSTGNPVRFTGGSDPRGEGVAMGQ